MLIHHPRGAVVRLAASLVTLGLAVWLWFWLAAPAAAQAPPVPTPVPAASPTPSATPRPTATRVASPGVGLPHPVPLPDFDPIALVGEGVQRALAELLANTLRPLRDALRDHLDRQFNILTITRPEHTVGLAQVRQLHAVSRGIANAAIALIVMVGGYNLIFRRHLTGDDAELWPLLGRVALAALVANTALAGDAGGWAGWLIALNNALIDAATRALPISVADLAAVGDIDPLNPAFWPRLGPGPLLALLILAVLLVVFLLWLLQMLMRLALLDLLLALAPLAMVLWALPQTERWAALWWRTFLPTLFCQFLQVAALGLATALASLVGIATLILVLKLPGRLGGGFLLGQSVGGGARASLAAVALARHALGRG